jgi:mono/diheme cytochrome c family protein
MKRAIGWGAAAVGLVLVVGALGALAVVQLRWDRTFDAPAEAVVASSDPEVIARGRALAYGPAHCADCHLDPATELPEVGKGRFLPLAGGRTFATPIGVFPSPNLTPDPETGIGRRTDAELSRLLRHNVRHDGRAALPAMNFQDLSREDLVALISFLRSQPPVRRAFPDRQVNLLGKAVFAFAIAPTGPREEPPATAPRGPTVERGRYLAHSVAACYGCHTARNEVDGSFVGRPFAGGNPFDDETEPDFVLVPPNLTPEPRTGRIAGWTEDDFVRRFRAGSAHPGSHMPWTSYARMSDDDLRALFRYLRTLEPVEHETGPSRQPRI